MVNKQNSDEMFERANAGIRMFHTYSSQSFRYETNLLTHDEGELKNSANALAVSKENEHFSNRSVRNFSVTRGDSQDSFASVPSQQKHEMRRE